MRRAAICLCAFLVLPLASRSYAGDIADYTLWPVLAFGISFRL